MKRDLYVVCLSGDNAPRAWKLMRDGEVCSYHDTQEAAIETGVMLCNGRLKSLGKNAELKIMGEDGKIRDSRTYGDDPPGIKG